MNLLNGHHDCEEFRRNDRVIAMRRVESGISIDNETFSDVTRYENETISRTTIINSNVRSPIFGVVTWIILYLIRVISRMQDFLPVVRLIIVLLFVPTCALWALAKTKPSSPIAYFLPAI